MSAEIADLSLCNPLLLEGYLSGGITQVQITWVERHLNDCRTCREALERQAASPEFWQATGRYLDPKQPQDTALGLSHGMQTPVLASWQSGIPADMLPEGDLDCEAFLKHWLEPSDQIDVLGTLDKYQVLGVISRGGMGLVLKAMDPDLNRLVAIKTLLQHLATSREAKLRFQREAQAAASIRHRHVIAIYAVDSWRDVPYIVMPYMQHGTLQQHARRHVLELGEILAVAIQVAEGLDAAHACGLVHRDIKPSNILLQSGLEDVVISDFGLARAMDDEPRTLSLNLAGTPQFMSPEQAQGWSIDARSDLFSFGSLLYWMCTGSTPFDEQTSFGVLTKIAQHPHGSVRQSAPHLPPWMDALIDRLLRKSPEQRLASASELKRLLTACALHVQEPHQHLLPHELLVPGQPADAPASNIRQASMQAWCKPSGLRRMAMWSGATIAACTVVLVLQSVVSNRLDRTPGTDLQNPSRLATAEIPERYGPLDAFDLMNLQSDVQQRQREHYWLRRLAYLSVAEVPAELVPWVETMTEADDATLRELAMVILNKNPFEIIDTGNNP